MQLLQPTVSLQYLVEAYRNSQKLFITIDQGDSLVARINPPFATQLPGSMAFGATGDRSNASKVAEYTAINTEGT